MADEPQEIPGDAEFLVRVTCPQCDVQEVVPLVLLSRIERTRDGGRLGLKVKAGKRDHDCGQLSLTVVAETGEVTRLDLGGDR